MFEADKIMPNLTSDTFASIIYDQKILHTINI